MRVWRSFPRILSCLLLFLPPALGTTSTPNTGDQEQGYLFAFPYLASNVVLPITPTCPSPLVLSKLSTTNNPKVADPVAPYTMIAMVREVLRDGAGIQYERWYTRSIGVGDVSQEQTIYHPWANGTQFIACIWSSNGVSGGCQDLFTVVPSDLTALAYANTSSTCRLPSVLGSWVTPSNQTLAVDVLGPTGGAIAADGWPAVCSDIQVTPKNGTAPYIVVIAPALHPPVNITSSTQSSMNYTVRLTHGQAFMIAVFDSAGNSFMVGPLHAGAADDLSCLQVATGQSYSATGGLGTSALAGGVAGSFVVGALGAALMLWAFCLRRRRHVKSGDSQELLDPYANPRLTTYRAESGTSSTFGKPGFSPDLAFESPQPLYDPHVFSSSAYPTPPEDQDSRAFRRSPSGGPSAYPSPYDSHQPFDQAYRDQVGLSDFHPRPSSINGGSRSAEGQGGTQGSGSGSGPGSAAARARGKGGRMQVVGGAPGSPRSWDEDEDDEVNSSRRSRNIYVVHSDGGGGDVHIQLPDPNARVIELPPNYRPDPSTTAGQGPVSATSPPVQDRTHGRNGSGGSGRLQRNPSEAEQMELPYLGLEPVRSRNSGRSEISMTPDELRARAEAAMAEKSMRPR